MLYKTREDCQRVINIMKEKGIIRTDTPQPEYDEAKKAWYICYKPPLYEGECTNDC